MRGAFDPGSGDFKTRLQERAQSLIRTQPRYLVVGTRGPDHDKTFDVALLLGDREVARGRGKSKKEAEQRAAERAVSALESPDKDPFDKDPPDKDPPDKDLIPTDQCD